MTYNTGDHIVYIGTNPFYLVVAGSDGIPYMGFNTRSMLHNDRTAINQEPRDGYVIPTDGLSDESSKKYGPVTLGFDITMFDASHLYGFPEHASSYQLEPTRGRMCCISLSIIISEG